MKPITLKKSPAVFSTSTLAITPLALYMKRVEEVSDSIRQTRQGRTYIPLQFGGFSGQRAVLSDKLVVNVVTFNGED